MSDELRIVDRKESMSPNGRLELLIQNDGDVIVTVYPDPSDDVLGGCGKEPASVEFCTVSGGGGSPKTHRALLELFRAMIEDNADPNEWHRRGAYPGKPEWIAR